jgi:hypothetical protein
MAKAQLTNWGSVNRQLDRIVALGTDITNAEVLCDIFDAQYEIN